MHQWREFVKPKFDPNFPQIIITQFSLKKIHICLNLFRFLANFCTPTRGDRKYLDQGIWPAKRPCPYLSVNLNDLWRIWPSNLRALNKSQWRIKRRGIIWIKASRCLHRQRSQNLCKARPGATSREHTEASVIFPNRSLLTRDVQSQVWARVLIRLHDFR